MHFALIVKYILIWFPGLCLSNLQGFDDFFWGFYSSVEKFHFLSFQFALVQFAC